MYRCNAQNFDDYLFIQSSFIALIYYTGLRRVLEPIPGDNNAQGMVHPGQVPIYFNPHANGKLGIPSLWTMGGINQARGEHANSMHKDWR